MTEQPVDRPNEIEVLPLQAGTTVPRAVSVSSATARIHSDLLAEGGWVNEDGTVPLMVGCAEEYLKVRPDLSEAERRAASRGGCSLVVRHSDGRLGAVICVADTTSDIMAHELGHILMSARHATTLTGRSAQDRYLISLIDSVVNHIDLTQVLRGYGVDEAPVHEEDLTRELKRHSRGADLRVHTIKLVNSYFHSGRPAQRAFAIESHRLPRDLRSQFEAIRSILRRHGAGSSGTSGLKNFGAEAKLEIARFLMPTVEVSIVPSAFDDPESQAAYWCDGVLVERT